MKAYAIFDDGGTTRITARTKAAAIKRAEALGAKNVRVHVPHGRRGGLQYETTERFSKVGGRWVSIEELGRGAGELPASLRKRNPLGKRRRAPRAARAAPRRRNPSLVTYLANPGDGVKIASDVQAILYRHATDGAYYLHVFGNQGDGELMRSRGREYLRIDNLPARTGVQLVGHGKVLTVRHRGGRALEREF